MMKGIYEHDIESYIITIRRKHTSANMVMPASAVHVSGVSEASQAGEDTDVSEKVVVAPLPGVVIAVNVKVGDAVKAGQVVAELEAMKMENDIQSEFDGTVISVNVSVGDSVPEGAAIVVIE